MQTITGAQLKQLPRFARLAIELDRIKTIAFAVDPNLDIDKTLTASQFVVDWPRTHEVRTHLGPVKQYTGLLSQDQIRELIYLEHSADPVVFNRCRDLKGERRELDRAVSVFLLHFRKYVPKPILQRLSSSKTNWSLLTNKYNRAVTILNTASRAFSATVMSTPGPNFELRFYALVGYNTTIRLFGNDVTAVDVFDKCTDDQKLRSALLPDHHHHLWLIRRDYFSYLLQQELDGQSAPVVPKRKPLTREQATRLSQSGHIWFDKSLKGFPDVLACVDTLIAPIRNNATAAELADIDLYRKRIGESLR